MMTTKLTMHAVITNWFANLTHDDWVTKSNEKLADELMDELKEWAELTKPGPYVKPKIIVEE